MRLRLPSHCVPPNASVGRALSRGLIGRLHVKPLLSAHAELFGLYEKRKSSVRRAADSRDKREAVVAQANPWGLPIPIADLGVVYVSAGLPGLSEVCDGLGPQAAVVGTTPSDQRLPWSVHHGTQHGSRGCVVSKRLCRRPRGSAYLKTAAPIPCHALRRPWIF